MLRELIDGLTTEQRTALRELGINRHRLADWRHGRRLPTEVQVAMLAAATGTEYGQLQREITWLRAKPEERASLARALGKSLAVVKAAIALGAVVMLGTFGASDRALASTGPMPLDRDNV